MRRQTSCSSAICIFRRLLLMAASQLAFRPLSKPHCPLRRTLSSTIAFSGTRVRCSCLPKTGQINVEIPVVLRNIRSVLPGGSWWKLSEYEEEAKAREVMPTLRRIWVLVEDERWVIFVAVGSLTLAAVRCLCFKPLVSMNFLKAIDLKSIQRVIDMTWRDCFSIS